MSDYDRWFISTDGTNTAILCKRERLIDALKDAMGAERAAAAIRQFRRATSRSPADWNLKCWRVNYV